MDYLTGKDYPHLCEGCQGAVDAMVVLIHIGAPDEYASDPEGPMMMAGDRGVLRGCPTCDPPETWQRGLPEFHAGFDAPQWTVFVVWDNWKDKTMHVLPICTCFDTWPIHGGTFDEVGQRLGWIRHKDEGSPVGCVYLHPTEDVSLHCLVFNRHPQWPGWSVASVVPALAGDMLDVIT